LQSNSEIYNFPRFRVLRDNDAVVLEVELPGVDEGALELDVHGKHITLAAKRRIRTGIRGETTGKTKAASTEQKYSTPGINGAERAVEEAAAPLMTEDSVPKYAAKFRLAFDADADAVKAELDAGILRIHASPRSEMTHNARRVEVSAGN
jgi:HSP20 family molecular chaperone IbpA